MCEGQRELQGHSRRGAALLIRGGRLAPTPSELQLCRDLPRRSYVHRHREAYERRCDYALYFVGPRCVRLFVFVCVCVCTLE